MGLKSNVTAEARTAHDSLGTTIKALMLGDPVHAKEVCEAVRAICLDVIYASDAVDCSAKARPEMELTVAKPAKTDPPAVPRRKQRVPAKEANIRVRDWLAKHGTEDPSAVKVAHVAEATGVSTGGVANTPAWNAFEERRKARSCAPRTIPLSNEILYARPDEAQIEPSALAEQEEELWNEILQKAESADKRARLDNMNSEQRRELIEAYRQQREEITSRRSRPS
jgi:hypothetical protein